jgi:hypothetical protein
MRIFVGTLKTIENEFEECVASIERQTYQNFEHFVFEDLPNKEAHDTLYRSFMERSDEFDLMVKVDADMVIENENLFAGIVERFEEHPQLKDLEIAVHDFFSDRLIWGMHAYRNTMTWETNEENLFVDRATVSSDEHVHDDEELAPAAIHCKNPSPFQAFHYGVHKALKMIQPGRWPKDASYAQFHWRNIEETRDHFRRTGDRRLGFAVLGAELAIREDIRPEHVSYSNPHLRRRFEAFDDLDAEDLRAEVERQAPYAFLPDRLRRPVLLYRDRLQSAFRR